MTTPSFIGRPATWCEYEYWRCMDGCPLRVAEGRLREAHRSWHDCAAAYQDPEDFRGSLNAAIQSLRNVTFAIQKVKSQLPGFDKWYPDEQSAMRADPLLKWAHGARNRVVKEDDLETKSILQVRLICTYADEAASVADEQHVWGLRDGRTVDPERPVTYTDAPTTLSLDEIFDEFARLDLPLSVRRDATVTVERRWVDKEIPDHELLSVIAYVFGAMNRLLTRAHELLGLHAASIRFAHQRVDDDVVVQPDVEYLEQLPLGGRLPCMASTRQVRLARYRLVDRSPVEQFRSHRATYDPDTAQQVVDSGIYGPSLVWPRNEIGNLQSKVQLAKAVAHYAALARGILESGQDHGWFTYYFRAGVNMGARIHMATDRQGKHAVASEISRAALETDADAVLMVSEVWMAPQRRTQDGAYVSPSLQEDRTEAVAVEGVTRSGARAGTVLPFQVVGGEPPSRVVEVGEPLPQNGTSNFLLPTLSAWGVEGREPLGGAAFWRAQRSAR